MRTDPHPTAAYLASLAKELVCLAEGKPANSGLYVSDGRN